MGSDTDASSTHMLLSTRVLLSTCVLLSTHVQPSLERDVSLQKLSECAGCSNPRADSCWLSCMFQVHTNGQAPQYITTRLNRVAVAFFDCSSCCRQPSSECWGQFLSSAVVAVFVTI
jgi:hypothetical protein